MREVEKLNNDRLHCCMSMYLLINWVIVYALLHEILSGSSSLTSWYWLEHLNIHFPLVVENVLFTFLLDQTTQQKRRRDKTYLNSFNINRPPKGFRHWIKSGFYEMERPLFPHHHLKK